MKAEGVRARVRAEMTEEIKAVARRHLATDGANLSLRAVARDMGMASSAVYRYFASRDDLLTALIIEAYDSVGEAAEQAAAAAASAGFADQLVAVGHAVREWALAEPHQWALIYGSPVPGYQAPQDTIGPATRVLSDPAEPSRRIIRTPRHLFRRQSIFRMYFPFWARANIRPQTIRSLSKRCSASITRSR